MALTPNHAAAEDPLVRRFETYLLSERNVSENTREGYLLDICQFVAFKWGSDVPPPYQWMAVSDNDARAFLASFSKDDASATTVRRKLAALRTFYRYLQREREVIDDPFAALKGPRMAKKLPRVLSVSDVTRFLERPKADFEAGLLSSYVYRRDVAIFEFLYSTGCRISEAIAVRWGEVDFRRGTVIVTGKGSKERLVILGQKALDALKELRIEVGSKRPELADDASAAFLSDRLEDLSARFVERRMNCRPI